MLSDVVYRPISLSAFKSCLGALRLLEFNKTYESQCGVKQMYYIRNSLYSRASKFEINFVLLAFKIALILFNDNSSN